MSEVKTEGLEVAGQLDNCDARIAELEAVVNQRNCELTSANRVMCAMVLDIVAVGEALSIPAEYQDGGTAEFVEVINQLRAQPAVSGLVPDGYKLVPIDRLKVVHRNLDACQKVIWLGMRGADPAYCADAQSSLKEIDAWLASPSAKEGE
jgi:hypothetical protein